MRDLVLAEQYKDAKIVFAVQDLEGNINHKILEDNYTIKLLKSDDIQEVVALVRECNIDLVVIDHYGIDVGFEKKLKNATNVQILSFDDTYERHCCDILLNHNVYADKLRYKDLVPEGCELRCGSEFTLLRDAFKKNQRKLSNLTPRAVLVAMGGADSAHKNIEILSVLEQFPNLHAYVVTTSANKNLESLRKYAKKRVNVTLHINTSRMAQLMAEVDFAILTPSVIVNEALYMRLPFVSIKTAENQRYMHDFLIANKYYVLPSFDKVQLEASVVALIHSLSAKLVNFIDLSISDKKLILKWRNDPNVCKWMFSKNEITLHQHMEYIEFLNAKSDRAYFLVSKGEESIGVVGFTSIDTLHKTAKLGIYANPQLRGVGDLLMKAILNYGFGELELKRVISEVYTENKAAVKLYGRCGFKEIQVFEFDGQGAVRMELVN